MCVYHTESFNKSIKKKSLCSQNIYNLNSTRATTAAVRLQFQRSSDRLVIGWLGA